MISIKLQFALNFKLCMLNNNDILQLDQMRQKLTET